MKAQFEIDSHVRFECSRCGDCCRTWNVMLGPGEPETLKALDWKDREADLVRLTPVARVRQKGMEDRLRLRRRPDGSCIFLGDANQCRIHQHFGGQAKPLICRLYPFGFYPVGERIGVDVSFHCRAVAEGRGKPLESRFPEWTRLLDKTSATASNTRPTGKHQLRAGTPLPADLLWEIEYYLLGFFAEDGLGFFDRLRCAVQFIRIGTTGDPAASTAAALREAMAKGIPIQIIRQPSEARMDKTQRAIFYQWLFLCLNPTPHGYHDWDESEQQREKSRRLKAGQRYLKQKGQPWVDDRELSVTFKDIARVSADISDRPRILAPLESFIKSKILGQKFLLAAERELPLVEAAQKFLLTVPMALWTSKALAADRGAGEVEEQDMRAALRLIDRSLGALPTSAMPRKQAEACDFIMLETDLIEAAVHDLIG